MDHDITSSAYSLTIHLRITGVSSMFEEMDLEAEDEFIRQAHENKVFLVRRLNEQEYYNPVLDL